MDEGNVCLDTNDIQALEDNEGAFTYDTGILERHPLVGRPEELKPFIFENGRLYTQRYQAYENAIVEQVKKLIAHENTAEARARLLQQKDFVRSLFRTGKDIGTDWQAVACINAFLNGLHIITGGPGTGKTTTVSKLLSILLKENIGTKIILAAPTGKAAARMKESQAAVRQRLAGLVTDTAILDVIEALDAVTIHRMLGYIPGSIYFRHGPGNPVDADVIVIDECSMIDIALFSKLFRAVDTARTKVILLGDKNQLASVEAGSLFGDICTSVPVLNRYPSDSVSFINSFIGDDANKIKEVNIQAAQLPVLSQHITELQHSYRFNNASGIGRLSHAILYNDAPGIQAFFDNADKQVQFVDFNENIINAFAAKLTDAGTGYMAADNIIGALKKINKSKILCTLKQGRQGVAALNRAAEQYIKNTLPDDFGGVHYNNRLIMVTSNQPENNIFNGDIGIISNEPAAGRAYACFWKNEAECNKVSVAHIREYETAYAMTIHKSQGSEFDEVLIVLPETENQLLTRELLYTAVTRARHKVTIMGNQQLVLLAANRSVNRISGIREKLVSVLR